MPQRKDPLKVRIKALESLDPGIMKKIIPETKKDNQSFKSALAKLSSDQNYRKMATANPTMLIDDFKLSVSQLRALREVAIMSGADIRKVDEIQALLIASKIRRPGGLVSDVSVSCCSCCCCCCGETAVETIGL